MCLNKSYVSKEVFVHRFWVCMGLCDLLWLVLTCHFWCLSKANTLTLLLLPFELVWNLTFLWPLTLNRRSDEEVTVDNFECLSKVNILTLLLLPFEVVCDLTFLWPLTLSHRSDKEVTIDFFWCLSNANKLTYFCHLSLFESWPYFWPLWPKWPQMNFWNSNFCWRSQALSHR